MDTPQENLCKSEKRKNKKQEKFKNTKEKENIGIKNTISQKINDIYFLRNSNKIPEKKRVFLRFQKLFTVPGR